MTGGFHLNLHKGGELKKFQILLNHKQVEIYKVS